ncbi:MAG TPA: LUD domain-containing protein [Thermoleophilia bacterium]|nr:LUD domain-containing protein [Thermoleophilia bacterium]
MNEKRTHGEHRHRSPSEATHLETVAAALQCRGMCAIVVDDQIEARRFVLDRLVGRARVVQTPSTTLEALGLSEEIEQVGRVDAGSPRRCVLEDDRQREEVLPLASPPDYVLSGVDAVTELGSLVLSSRSLGPLGPQAGRAGQVIFIAGRQKIVPDLDAAFRRLCSQTEDPSTGSSALGSRADAALEQILIIGGDSAGRLTVVLVDESLEAPDQAW